MQTIKHIGQVFGINFGAIFLTYQNVDDLFKTLGLIAAFTYTAIKIYKEIKK